MALVPITITGRCLDASGEPFAEKPVYFSPAQVFGADEDAIATQTVQVTTDEDGEFTVILNTLDDVGGYVRYAYILPSGDAGIFDLADDSPTEFGDLVTLGSVESGDVGAVIAALNALIATHAAVKASTTVLGHVKVDGTTITINGSGVISSSGGGGGGGDVATDTIFDAKGDLVAGTGSNTASRLPVGPNNTFLVPDSALANGLKWITAPLAKVILALTKGDVGLGNVDNTSDANKPISTATQTALDLKAPIANPTFTGTVGGVTKSMVGLGNVDNTSDANKPISTATQTALDEKQAADSDLTDIAALSPANDDLIQRKSGVWVNRTIAQVKSDLGILEYTPEVNIRRALGSTIFCETAPIERFTATQNLTSGQVKFHAVWFPCPAGSTITGVKWLKYTIGNYVASGLNNKIGLYTYSGGTLTLVASSTDQDNLWMQGNDIVVQKAFATPYVTVAAPTVYFIGELYRNSSQTTAPAMWITPQLFNSSVICDYTNSAKFCAVLNGQTDLPASVAMSALSAHGFIGWRALY